MAKPKYLISPYGSIEYYREWRAKNKDRTKVHRARYHTKHPIRKRYWDYRYSAKVRGIEFGINYEDFITFWRKPCVYCGKVVKTVGLDRVDNTHGYLNNNIVSCCSVCNRMKGVLTMEEFIKHCRLIANKQ